jgi:signal transduction histidine kinase
VQSTNENLLHHFVQAGRNNNVPLMQWLWYSDWVNTRTKVLGLIAIILLVSITTLYGASQFLIQQQLSAIEQKEMVNTTGRAADTLRNRIDTLDSRVKDWSSWDDTYDFIQDHNQAYVTSNLVEGTIQGLDINFILYYNTAGKLLYFNSIDLETGEPLAIPDALQNPTFPQGTFLVKDEKVRHSGLLRVENRPLMFSAQPILTSQGQGPYRGTLVFAKYLLASDFQKLATLSHLSTTYALIDDTLWDKDSHAIASDIPSDTAKVVVQNDQAITGYQRYNDAAGKPLLTIKVTQPRTLFREASQAVTVYLYIVIGVLAVSVLLIELIFRQLSYKDKIISLKDEFFSMATHELRTPLTAIKGNAQLIQTLHAQNNAELKDMAQDIYDSSVRLIKVVTSFLDAARLEQGKVPFVISTFALHDIAAKVVDQSQAMAAQKGVEVICQIDDPALLVSADPDRVEQIIYNLLGNALKFTDTGSITLTATVEGSFVKVHVADTGRGISKQDQQRVFAKFSQAKHADINNGTGLGLYITRMLVTTMGGTIDLESSEVGHGTTMYFTLPRA